MAVKTNANKTNILLLFSPIFPFLHARIQIRTQLHTGWPKK